MLFRRLNYYKDLAFEYKLTAMMSKGVYNAVLFQESYKGIRGNLTFINLGIEV